jgi:DNA-binding NarL/FixJ family response regulator
MTVENPSLSKSPECSPSKPTKVLIADDKEYIRTILESMFKERLNGESLILHAQSPEEAIVTIQNLKPDIVICDGFNGDYRAVNQAVINDVSQDSTNHTQPKTRFVLFSMNQHLVQEATGDNIEAYDKASPDDLLSALFPPNENSL